uniref:Uncharacterized protein n=1 Tax=Accipiter nisus TaxID=211598 RepID=A0A8B9RUN7_9AVES
MADSCRSLHAQEAQVAEAKLTLPCSCPSHHATVLRRHLNSSFSQLCRIPKSLLHPKSPAPPCLPIGMTHASWPHELHIGRASPPHSQPGASEHCVIAGRSSTH